MPEILAARPALGLLDEHGPLIAANDIGYAQDSIEEKPFFTSIDRNDIVRVLGALFLDEISGEQPEIAAHLQDYLAFVLNNSPQQDFKNGKSNGKSFDEELNAAREQEQKDIALEDLARRNYQKFSATTEQRNLYIAHMARLAQIIEISGHLARENFFDIKRRQRDIDPKKGGVPGGIERIFYKVDDEVDDLFTRGDRTYEYKTPEEAIKYLGTPVLEISLTQHPTNVLAFRTILLKRQLHDAAREICTNPAARLDDIKKRIRWFSKNELTPVDADGKISNFNGEDELDITLDTVEQIDRHSADLYGTYERAFVRRWGEAYTKTMRWDLHFDLRVNSWVMGDKDGNQNVKAEHLLLATVKHRQKALTIALKHLAAMKASGVQLAPEWKEKLRRAQENLAQVKAELDAASKASGGIDLILKQEDLDRLSQASAAALGEDWSGFEKNYIEMLKEKGQSASGAQEEALLRAYRSVKVTGLRGAKIELRETSDQYSVVIATLVKHDANGNPVDYTKLSPKKQAQLLDALIQKNPDYLTEQARIFLAQADAEKLRNYKGENAAETITYHTLKRYQEAAANPDMYSDSIIAECKGAHHMLECLALQKMISGITQKPLRLHIAPLFEEYSTLNFISRILKSAYHYPSYRAHVYELAQQKLDQLRQKFQIAHSDNIRRSGTVAGRGGIHAAHRDVPRIMKSFQAQLATLYAKDGIVAKAGKKLSLFLEIFEGGSLSHILRGGGRSLSSMTNAFKLHRHTKITVQGADQLNHYGYSTSFKRATARFFAHNSKEIALEENTNPLPASHPLVEKVISKAFKSTMSDYVDIHFGNKEDPKKAGMGHLLAHPIVNYLIYSLTGNRGMRNAARGNVKKTTFIDTEKDTRAIGIAENMFDADLLGTWLGSENLLSKLSAHLMKGAKTFEAFRRQVNTSFGASIVQERRQGRLLTTQELNGLYRTSPQYRDVFDQLACGLYASNIDRLQRRLLQSEKAGHALSPEVRAYVFETLPKAYIQSAETVLSAFGVAYNKEEADRLGEKEKITYLRHMIGSHAIPSYAAEYGAKLRFATAAVLARDEILSSEKPDSPLTTEEYRALSNLVAARMIASHGRVFTGDDPHYASSLRHFVKRFLQTPKLPTPQAA